MFRLLFVACLAVAAYGGTLPAEFSEWEGRVVGGSNAQPGQFPYQISLRSANNQHFCGGSVLNNRWVITAAHCTVGRNTANTVVVVGTHLQSSGGTLHRTSRIVVHEYFNGNSMENDVSVIQTATNIVYNNLVQPIGISTSHIGAGLPAVGSGWGQISHPGNPPNNLQYVSLSTIDFNECRNRHLNAGTAGRVHQTTICTLAPYGKGMCMGDSGGPLASQGTLAGLVSWGLPCAVGYPDVFTRVSSHYNWIVRTIQQ